MDDYQCLIMAQFFESLPKHSQDSGITKEQLESQKVIGMLLYGIERLLKFKISKTNEQSTI
ncbi:hypothetical protein N7535_005051 [Penicillium sp. DV-2018c]|nr:hypothetical protein N7461_008631 [Penicillium sp. DV-2018c]KAJ5571391.1 hypothetical protein N7535_005051 [Penicillium sp. DV-2018c]